VPGSAVFDGTHYLIPFSVSSYGWSEAPKNIFLARVNPTDGSIADAEEEGLLVHSEWTNVSSGPRIAIDALHSLVIFGERRNSGGPFNTGGKILAVPMLGHAPDPSFVAAAIGTIGPRSLDERSALKLALSAPGLDPAITVFSATGLPDGAYLDPSTGLFAWNPNGAQAGNHTIEFAASDGTSNLAENVTVTVGEASLSFSGTVTLASDGSPVPNVALKLGGFPRRRQVTYTDPNGRYRFESLLPGRTYRVGLFRPSSKEYRAEPRRARASIENADAGGLDLVLTPK